MRRSGRVRFRRDTGASFSEERDWEGRAMAGDKGERGPRGEVEGRTARGERGVGGIVSDLFALS